MTLYAPPSTHRTFVNPKKTKWDSSKMWRTIKVIDGKSQPKTENEAITFDDTQVSSLKQIANRFNRQFTTSKRGKDSPEIRLVSREVRRKSMEMATTFTSDMVANAIRSCTSSPSTTAQSSPARYLLYGRLLLLFQFAQL